MPEKPLTFQQVIMRLEQFWAEHGCLIWQPYSEKVGAGTMNPATVLRVLGPEPWNVAYVEPSYRPDDGRYGENPNRMQMHIQYQVILKPDPGNPQELYLQSLEAIGIDRSQHDIRFVEDNWESPALGAWGLGWEVWLDGLEITQFTYFQQAGGFPLDPVAVELTYGLERIVMYLQGVRSVWEIDWDGQHTYGQVLLPQEIEHCKYNFDYANVERLKQMYNLFEDEAQNALAAGLVTPAHDYVLRCSHTFNVLDARGAIGVTERASYFARMRDLARQVAEAYAAQRKELGFPFLKQAPVSRFTFHVSRSNLKPSCWRWAPRNCPRATWFRPSSSCGRRFPGCWRSCDWCTAMFTSLVRRDGWWCSWRNWLQSNRTWSRRSKGRRSASPSTPRAAPRAPPRASPAAKV